MAKRMQDKESIPLPNGHSKGRRAALDNDRLLEDL